MRAIAEARIKNDRLDSEILAHLLRALLRAELVPEAYAPSKEIRAVKRVLRQRNEVGEVERFPSPKKFAAYTGLVPSTYASGDRLKYGKMTKQGNNKWLRWAYVEAVRPAMVVSPYVRRNYERIKLRKGAADARVATARKLSELTWKLWKEGRCYEER